jgi:hypothetical protein
LLKLHYTLHHFLPLLLLLLHSLYDDYSVELRVHRPLLNCSLVLQATFFSGSQGCALFLTQLIQCVWNLKNSWCGGSQLPLCSPWPIDDASIPPPGTTRGRTLPCPEAVRRPGMPVSVPSVAGASVGPTPSRSFPSQPFVDWSLLALPYAATRLPNSSSAVCLSDEETLESMIPGCLGYCSRRVPLPCGLGFRVFSYVCFFFFLLIVNDPIPTSLGYGSNTWQQGAHRCYNQHPILRATSHTSRQEP